MTRLRSAAFLAVLASACLSFCQSAPPTSALQGAFVENRGQWDSRAQFLSQSPGLNTWITEDGVVYDFHSFTRTNPVDPSPKLDIAKGILKGQVVHVSFENAYRSQATGLNNQPGVFNYIGNHPTIKSVHRYSEANTGEIYKGVSARYYYDQGSPRYDLIVNPGADPTQIGMRIEGANGLSVLSNGNLEMQTVLGSIQETGLTVYQGEGSNRRTVPAKMVLEDNLVHFQLGNYDKTQKLTIDPVIYSSYIGGNGGSGIGDKVNAIANWVSSAGYLQQSLVGNTGSTNFPTTTGAYQTLLQGEDQGFIAEMDWYSNSLLWCTYLQGASLNSSAFLEPLATVADYSGIYVAGAVENETYPTTAGAFQTTNGNTANLAGFVSKISSDGTSLLASSLVTGSNGNTFITGMAYDSVGEIMLTGRTFATNFPTTVNAYQSTNQDIAKGYSSAFATKISANLKTLVASTYFGGTGGEIAYAVAPTTIGGTNDEFVIAGSTASTNLPVSSGCWQSNNKTTGGTTGFAATLSADATGLLYSSYFGGSTYDVIYSIFIDSNQNIVFGGTTRSSDLPVDYGINGKENGFLGSISGTENQLAGCGYVGGSGYDQITSIAPGYAGNGIFVAGTATSTDFPVTPGCYQPTLQGTSSGFVALYDFIGTAPTYSTYFGSNTGVLALSTDLYANPVIGGTAGVVPVTPGAFQSSDESTSNSLTGFLAKITPEPEYLAMNFQYLTSSIGGDTLPVTVTLSSVAPLGGATVTLASDNTDCKLPVASVFIPANSFTYKVNMTSNTVSAAEVVHITATCNGAQIVGAFSLLPHGLNPLVVPTKPVVGGSSVTCTVPLSGPAGATNMILHITSSDTTKVQVPATMTILAGKSSGTFVATTSPVNASSPVIVKVSNATNYHSAYITVAPPTPSTITATPNPVAGGKTATGTVTLTGKAGSLGAVVTLKNLAPAQITIPTSVKVLAGATYVTFPIETASVDVNKPASIEGTFNSITASGSLIVAPATVGSVKLSSPTITGGTSETGTVTLGSPAGPSGVVVQLESSNMTVAQIPTSVKVAPWTSTANFAITSFQVLANGSSTISASIGSNTVSTSLSVIPIQLSAISVLPSTVLGGAKVQATITITGGITNTAIFVNVASSAPAAAKPEVAQLDFGTKGVTAMTDAIDTYAVSVAATVTLTASYNGFSKTCILNVNPASFTSLILSAPTVVGGVSLMGTVNLNGAAGPAGTVVTLQSSNTKLVVPASVKVLAATTSIQFTITTSTVTASTPVTITATWGSVVKSVSVTLSP